MDAALERFLRATDLDGLLDARQQLSHISKADADDLRRVVTAWDDPQAVANLLMYPEVIPEALRPDAVLRALGSPVGEYQVLAAVVGAGRWAEAGDIDADVRRRVADRLLELLAIAPGPISARASVAIGEYLDDVGLDRLVPVLAHADGTVFHNVLAVAAGHDGVSAVAEAVGRARSAGVLDDTTADAALEELENLHGMRALPELAYIPDRNEWDPAVTWPPA